MMVTEIKTNISGNNHERRHGDGDVEWDEALPIFQAQGPTRLIKKSCFYGRNPPISNLEVHRKMMKHVPSAAPKLNLFELNYFLQTPF